jgi:hypothetical protein
MDVLYSSHLCRAHAMRRLGSLAHVAYADLVRLLADGRAADLRGTPVLTRRGARGYWYDTYRIGNQVKKRYLGEDGEALRAALARHHEITRESAARRAEQARLVRILRGEGLAGVEAGLGSLLSAFATAGVFRLGGTLVGTAAFSFYEGELGVAFGADALARTGDIDLASFQRLSLVLEDQVSEPLDTVLGEFAFKPLPALDQAATWRWSQSGGNVMVEFLTPSFEANEGLRPLKALGVTAQSLHFLNYLIGEPIRAAALYRAGVLVQIPRPERFAIHKLIVASRRRDGPDALKARKDRAQAAALIEVLAEDRPEDLAAALQDARARGSRWRSHVDDSLRRMPQTAERLKPLE